MDLPQLDKRSREDLLNQIAGLAGSYTPEWRLNRNQPDMGSALAQLFADMTADALEEYNRVLMKHKRAFFHFLKSEPMPASFAEGYMVFGLVKDNMPEAVIPAGSKVRAKCDDGGTIDFVTLEELYVSASQADRVLVLGAGEEEPAGWYIGFDKCPSKGLLSLLFLISGTAADRDRVIRCETYGEGGWEPVTISDGTDRLNRTGTIRFAGTPRMAGKEIGGEESFWLRIVADGEESLPDCVPGVWTNAARVRAEEPGRRGNLTAGGEHRMMQTVGYVSSVKNPDAFFGGADVETEERCLARRAAQIRHQGRAVSPRDFESLAREASDQIARASCFTGYGGDGGQDAGKVTLVVLQKDYREGRSGFFRLRRQVLDYLASRTGKPLVLSKGLEVVPPWFVMVDVCATLTVWDHGQVIQAERDAVRLLDEYLDPLEGGYDGKGWELGSVPGYEQVRRLLQTVPSVGRVSQILLRYSVDRGNGWEETDLKRLSACRWILPLGGRPKIRAAVGSGEARRGGGYD